MSREIKVRAWDTKRKKMWSAEQMGKDQLTLSPDGRGFINVSGVSTKLSTYLDHFIPEQYTGWKDYKEQDLYDGDIATATWQCTVCYDTEPHVLTGIVEWSNECAMWMFDYGHGSVPLGSDELDNILKIGNIHENPELLKCTDADKETGR